MLLFGLFLGEKRSIIMAVLKLEGEWDVRFQI